LRSKFAARFVALTFASAIGCASVEPKPSPRPAAPAIEEDDERDGGTNYPVSLGRDQCPGYRFEKGEFSFAPYAPRVDESTKSALGPGTAYLEIGQKVLYRGLPASARDPSIPLVLRAILGDATAYVGTALFEDLRRDLRGEKTLSSRYEEWTASIRNELALARKCAQKKGRDDRVIARLARDLTTKYFRRIEADGTAEIPSRFFDYASKDRQDGTAVLAFGNVSSKTADHVGERALVFQDPRALSLPLWNRIRHGKWESEGADFGEAVVPGYLSPTSILGMDVRVTGFPAASPAAWNRQTDFAIRRVVVDGVVLALVFDAAKRDCIQRLENGWYVCDNPPSFDRSWLDLPSPSSVGGLEASIGLIGAFRVCPPKGKCALPPGLERQFRASKRSIPEVLKRIPNSFSIGGKVVRYFPAIWQVPDPVIRIEEATYGVGLPGISRGNVTSKAAAFCETKASCTYAVSKDALGDPAPGRAKAFELKWICVDRPKDVRVEKIPAPAEGKTLELKCVEEASAP
jgi:hypothetical protein